LKVGIEMDDMKELVALIAKALVDKPDEVVVTENKGEHASVIELKVAKEDLGKVIGKRGRTAEAMRNILMAASAKLKKRCILEILE
jgi:hypothetical protein